MMHVPSRRNLFSMVAALLVLTAPVLFEASPAEARAIEARKPIVGPRVGPKIELPKALGKVAPESVEDLAAIERHVQKLLPGLLKATVGVRAGGAQGSGVIISQDGYVLTAGHVSQTAGRNVTLIFQDGKTVRGKTLGAFQTADAGLIRITDKGKWPFIPIGDIGDVSTGDWCIVTGHPGGYRKGRAPVVRLGRVIRRFDYTVQTDAILVGGDSGGPLFDMHGRVMGINSRIGRDAEFNFHVSIDSFSEPGNWDGMARGVVWTRPVMGVNGEDHEKGCRITGVPRTYPAERAGLRVGDVITAVDGKKVKGFDDLVAIIREMRSGDEIVVKYLRDGEAKSVSVTLAGQSRQSSPRRRR